MYGKVPNAIARLVTVSIQEGVIYMNARLIQLSGVGRFPELSVSNVWCFNSSVYLKIQQQKLEDSQLSISIIIFIGIASKPEFYWDSSYLPHLRRTNLTYWYNSLEKRNLVRYLFERTCIAISIIYLAQFSLNLFFWRSLEMVYDHLIRKGFKKNVRYFSRSTICKE